MKEREVEEAMKLQKARRTADESPWAVNMPVKMEDQEQEVMKSLKVSRTADELSWAVAISGFGGIGKITLATTNL
ncbi:hypothetical protein KI387_035952, partial [Taxus chinensis]